MVSVPGNKKFGMELLRVNNEAKEESREHTMKGFVSYVKDFEIYPKRKQLKDFKSENDGIRLISVILYSACFVEVD